MSDSLQLHGQFPLSVGFPRQEYWSGLPFPSPEDLPDPEIKPLSPESPVLAGGFFFFTTEPPGKPRKFRGGDIRAMRKKIFHEISEF